MLSRVTGAPTTPASLPCSGSLLTRVWPSPLPPTGVARALRSAPLAARPLSFKASRPALGGASNGKGIESTGPYRYAWRCEGRRTRALMAQSHPRISGETGSLPRPACLHAERDRARGLLSLISRIRLITLVPRRDEPLPLPPAARSLSPPPRSALASLRLVPLRLRVLCLVAALGST
jgi:hypothetical protein